MTKSNEIFLQSNPYTHIAQTAEGNYPRAVFVCTAGMLRSPTAARVATQLLGWNTRSCGTWRNALILLSEPLIMWADKIYFVNSENYNAAVERFNVDVGVPAWVAERLVAVSTVWNIPDTYNYMQPELVDQITKLLLEPIA